MANSYKALTLALFLCLGTTAVHAGYAQAKPPQGWSTSGFNGSKAANSASYYPGGVRTSPTVNVGGKAVTMPANIGFAANAPRFAGAVLFANPYIRGAAAIATWLGIAGLVYDATSGLWQKPDTSNPDYYYSTGYIYQTGGIVPPSPHNLTPQGACRWRAKSDYAEFISVSGEVCTFKKSGKEYTFPLRMS